MLSISPPTFTAACSTFGIRIPRALRFFLPLLVNERTLVLMSGVILPKHAIMLQKGTLVCRKSTNEKLVPFDWPCYTQNRVGKM